MQGDYGGRVSRWVTYFIGPLAGPPWWDDDVSRWLCRTVRISRWGVGTHFFVTHHLHFEASVWIEERAKDWSCLLGARISWSQHIANKIHVSPLRNLKCITDAQDLTLFDYHHETDRVTVNGQRYYDFAMLMLDTEDQLFWNEHKLTEDRCCCCCLSFICGVRCIQRVNSVTNGMKLYLLTKIGYLICIAYLGM